MNNSDKNKIVNNYRELLFKHGRGPAVGQWSEEGQKFRFEKLSTIGLSDGMSILEIGCGLGDFFPYLTKKFDIEYTGIDIVPELIDLAKSQHQSASFFTMDLFEDDLNKTFDFVLISGVFNNEIENPTSFLLNLITRAFKLCEHGVGFNFTSKYVNQTDKGMAFHDPIEIFKFCIEKLSKKVVISHHYERCDVSVFV